MAPYINAAQPKLFGIFAETLVRFMSCVCSDLGICTSRN